LTKTGAIKIAGHLWIRLSRLCWIYRMCRW